MISIPTPSINGATPEVQISQLKNYINMLAETLQYSLNSIGMDSLDSKLQKTINTLISSIEGEEQ